jgi:hypothetical protein
MSDSIAETGRSLAGSVQSAGRSLEDQGARLNAAILQHFRDQPLVGGALAFAVGAAIGAALPHTDTEDEAMGEAADEMRSSLAAKTNAAVGDAIGTAQEAMDRTGAAALEAHDAARERVREAFRE